MPSLTKLSPVVPSPYSSRSSNPCSSELPVCSLPSSSSISFSFPKTKVSRSKQVFRRTKKPSIFFPYRKPESIPVSSSPSLRNFTFCLVGSYMTNCLGRSTTLGKRSTYKHNSKAPLTWYFQQNQTSQHVFPLKSAFSAQTTAKTQQLPPPKNQ